MKLTISSNNMCMVEPHLCMCAYILFCTTFTVFMTMQKGIGSVRSNTFSSILFIFDPINSLLLLDTHLLIK